MNNIVAVVKTAAAARRTHHQTTDTINSTTEYILELFLGFWDDVSHLFDKSSTSSNTNTKQPRTSFRTHPTSPFADPSSSKQNQHRLKNNLTIEEEDDDPDETPRPSTSSSSSSSPARISNYSSTHVSTTLTPYQQWKSMQHKHKGNYTEYTADLEKGKQKKEAETDEENDEETTDEKCARIFNVGDKDKFLKKYYRQDNTEQVKMS
jgi:hypothetical protein